MRLNRIAILRARNGWSQEYFAELMECSQSSVTSWETGNRNPSVDTICKIASIFDVSVDYLLGLTDDPKKPEPIIADDELRTLAIDRVQSLSDPALVRVLDFLSGLAAGQEIASEEQADHDPDSQSSG